ncbi:MAG: hypothetical protein M1827_005390 [Pycnora praestabilis]|nr:MAG: hypothetical protein M1827_005390 [Pycnora praestabilis]
MVELRKRKEPASAPSQELPTKKGSKAEKATASKARDVTNSNGGPSKADDASTSVGKPAVGDSITLDGFGGEIETNDSEKVTLKKLVGDSKGGVVLFTYPKASTPGCTTQACLFRDSYKPLTASGLAIYGLSSDSPKSNTTFKTKQNLPYTLLCDPGMTLIGAIGFKKAPKGITRGVFVVDKKGKVLAAEAGGPAATVDIVQTLIGTKTEDVGNMAEGEEVEKEIEKGELGAEEATQEPVNAKDDAAKAGVAADVADTAEKLDGDEAEADVAADVADTAERLDDKAPEA